MIHSLGSTMFPARGEVLSLTVEKWILLVEIRDAERTLVFNASAPQDPMRQVVRMRRGLMQKRELAWDHFCLKRHERLGRERNYMTHTSKSETIPYLLNQMFPSNDFPRNMYIYTLYIWRKPQDKSLKCTEDLVYHWCSHTTCTINLKHKTFSVTAIHTKEEIHKPRGSEL